jgi:hypothetical protein
MQKKPKNARSKGLPEPLPATCTVPQAGAHFFGVGTPGAYRLARKGIIPVLRTGSRNMVALPRVLAARLNNDPQNSALQSTAQVGGALHSHHQATSSRLLAEKR